MQVAVFNMMRILEESKKGKELGQQIATAAQAWQTKLRTVEHKLEQLRKSLESDASTAKMDAVMRLDRERQMAELELQQMQDRMRTDLNSMRDQFRMQVMNAMNPALQALVKERGIALVLAMPAPEIVYVSEIADITSVLLQRFDALA